MVSTRSHPSAFPPPELASPTKSPSKRGASRASSTAPPVAQPSNKTSTTQAANTTPAALAAASTSSDPSTWTHTPSNLTLAWLALSLPLVIWDTGYMLLRPHSMPGGYLHWPIWQPYALYGTVDHVYGFPAYEKGDGFGAAQATLNAVETLLYLGYLAVVFASGRQAPETPGRGAPDKARVGGAVGGARAVGGRVAARAVLLAFAASVMTLSKTVLYWLNEAWGGFDNIGHNDAVSLVFLWVIPNGLWLIFPTYMIYVFGGEIVQGLEAAGAAAPSKKSQ
ncbi:hypothetical protein MPH_05606 [Macrophomina phaseolina MS6]|uniref:Emopamil-binding protein n=1 Tax=Macrophomina phaseolina (strain MS6) TaxID=1126212 RepID=K2RWR3_MACPH|nr:hypothetical protein MPH_05606 [Macrophomina phaseolina MS6]